jgi:outer membrane protein assembly factor BamB
MEVFLALNAETGQELWATPVGPAAREGIAGEGDGPRSTPAVDGDNVYVLNAYLALYCLNAKDGSTVWKRDLLAEFGGRGPDFEAAASPLVEGDLVLVNGPMGGPGEKLFGINKRDGRTVWQGPSAKLTHSTPVATTFLGVRQALFFTGGGMLSVIPETGKELWRHAFNVGVPTTISPVVGGDIVYHSAGYGIGARAVRVARSGDTFRVTELWRKSGQLINFLSTPIYHEGYLYGLYGDKQYGTGPLTCVALATGEEKWSQPGFGVGQVLLVDGHLLVQDDDGALVLVKPDPQRYIQIARYQALNSKSWNGPAISNGRIYARSTKEGVCLDMTPKAMPKLKLYPGFDLEHGFRLFIGPEDASPLDASRAANIAVFSATDIRAGSADWTRLTLAPVLTNGLLRLEDPQSATTPQRFFKAQE